jgi:NAD(P)-dependent dehydrogenase (short-subunit alcohol dehydrogenase family)
MDAAGKNQAQPIILSGARWRGESRHTCHSQLVRILPHYWSHGNTEQVVMTNEHRQPEISNQRATKGSPQKENSMDIANKTVLITGANRGIGLALVNEALRRGAKRVYAGTRGALVIADECVTPVTLDVINEAQIEEAVRQVGSLDVLINNSGIAPYDDLSDSAIIEQTLAVNFFGMYKVSRAFLPLLKRSKGAIINNLSLMALAPLPLTPSYAISKAAALSMTQSLRALLASQGVTVHGVFLGPVDTDMTRGFEIPKATPEAVAQGIFDGLENKEEDIFPDPMSKSIAEGWRNGIAKAFERQYAGFVPQSAAV